jgi:hypothetical protein
MPIATDPVRRAVLIKARKHRIAATRAELDELQLLLEEKHRLTQLLVDVRQAEAAQAAAKAELRRQTASESAYGTAARTAAAEVELIERQVRKDLYHHMHLLELWQRDPNRGSKPEQAPARVFRNEGACYG